MSLGNYSVSYTDSIIVCGPLQHCILCYLVFFSKKTKEKKNKEDIWLFLIFRNFLFFKCLGRN